MGPITRSRTHHRSPHHKTDWQREDGTEEGWGGDWGDWGAQEGARGRSGERRESHSCEKQSGLRDRPKEGRREERNRK